jgi:hypothetical protein
MLTYVGVPMKAKDKKDKKKKAKEKENGLVAEEAKPIIAATNGAANGTPLEIHHGDIKAEVARSKTTSTKRSWRACRSNSSRCRTGSSTKA